MVANQKVTGRAASVPAGLGIALGVSMVITLAMAALTAYLEGKGIVKEADVGYMVMLTLLLASLVGALTAAGKIKRQRLVMCLASGLCYFLSLIAVTALFFGGQYSGVGVSLLLIMGAAFSAAFLKKGERKSTSVRKRKFKNR